MQFRKIGNGTPIVFLPGLFAGGWIWDAVVDKCIEEGFSALVFNNAIPITFGNSFKQAIKVLDMALEGCKEKPFLVGNSLGALISLHYTLQNPSRIQGLVMSGAPGLIELEAGVQLNQVRTGGDQAEYPFISSGVNTIKLHRAEPWVNLAKQFENIQASIIAECGHSPMVELPQSFLDMPCCLCYIALRRCAPPIRAKNALRFIAC
jgi:hypothetical protein